jgi:DNA-binding NtrC family response regulator
LNAYSNAATTPLSFGLNPSARDTQAPQKRKARILVVDDDPGLLRLLTIRLRAENYEVEAVESAAAALAACVRFRPDLVITDLRMDQMDGIGLLKELQSRWPGLRVIILTAHGTIPDAVHATQSGAFGFLTKPVDKQDLLDHVQKALKVSGFAHVDEDWRSNIITRNQLMEDKLAQANMVAGTDARVLLTGESGTGKELLARAIHEASPRRNKPFVSVNCSAMAENLLESELFGHAKGAFTGASIAKAGKFELADRGTLLLDEIGELPLNLQPKLLRVLQEREFERLGETRPTHVDIRVIATTNASLGAMVEQGSFRSDLYYRLNVIPLSIPALRERAEDIPLLARYFAEKFTMETDSAMPALDPSFIDKLQAHSWPGNIRELSNFMRRVLSLNPGAIIDGACFSKEFRPLGRAGVISHSMPVPGTPISVLEKMHLENTLALAHGNRTHAAEMLGISLRTMRNRIKEYGLPPRRYA